MKFSPKLKKILRVILAIFIIFYFVTPKGDFYVIVKGGSMEPALKNNQVVLATKDTSKLFVGDIVVIERNNEKIVKRITAVQGDKYVENINDEHTFSLLPEWIKPTLTILPGIKLIIKEIPANFYFVEGDNPEKSIDSKNFGLVRRNEIVGKCLYN